MDYKNLCQQVLNLVGGPDNIESFTNCMTRLRLNLIDDEKVQADKLKSIKGVLGVVTGEQLMVILGPGHAQRARDAMEEILGRKAGDVVDEVDINDIAKTKHSQVKSKQTAGYQKIFRKFGNIFIPILPAWIGCGLIYGFVNICKNINPGILSNPWFYLLSAVGGLIGSILHVIVGYNAAKEFGGTPALGAVAAALIYSDALNGVAAKGDIPAAPLSVPFLNISFSSGLGGVLGVVFAAFVFSYLEKKLRKVIPAMFEMFLVPLITILVGGLLTILIVQPIAALLNNIITFLFVDIALRKGGILGGFFLSAFYLPLVMLGIHRIFTAVHVELIAQTGYTILLPILAMSGAGQVGMALAIIFKTKNKHMKQMVTNALPVGMLGIGEPLIYGVSLPLGKPFITACIGAGFGGAFLAAIARIVGDVGASAPTTSGLVLTLLIENNMWMWYLIAILIAYAAGFIFTYFFGFDDSLLARLDNI